MTREQAEYVKQLRCLGATYRAIAKHYGRKYPEASEIGDNQLNGGWLVVEASLILDESARVWSDIGKRNFELLRQFTRELMGVSVAHMTESELDAFVAPFRRIAKLIVPDDSPMPLWLQKRFDEERVRLLTVLARRR